MSARILSIGEVNRALDLATEGKQQGDLSLPQDQTEDAGSMWVEVPTRQVKPSQTCHRCGIQRKKPQSERTHRCDCGASCSREEPRNSTNSRVSGLGGVVHVVPVLKSAELVARNGHAGDKGVWYAEFVGRRKDAKKVLLAEANDAPGLVRGW